MNHDSGDLMTVRLLVTTLALFLAPISACGDLEVTPLPSDFRDSLGSDGTPDSGSATSIPQDMAAYYPFDADDEDLSGNEHDLELVFKGTFTADRFGMADRAYDFSKGTGIYYPTGMASHLSVWPDVTMAVWVKGGSGGNERRIMGQQDWMQLAFDGSVVRFGLDDDVLGEAWAEATGHPGDRWTFYVGMATRIDDTEGDMLLSLYRDGELVASGTAAGVAAESPSGCLFFVGPQPNIGKRGCTEPDAAAKLSATLDDVRVYRRGLSPGEIEALYREGGW